MEKASKIKLGFSMLELSLVLLTIAILVGSSLLVTAQFEFAKTKTTEDKLDIIEQALVNFVATNKRLPCPADPKLDIFDVSAGLEVCADGVQVSTVLEAVPLIATLVNPVHLNTAFYSTSNTSTATPDLIYGGAVPVRTLDLPNSFMIDGWDRKYTYLVSGTLANPTHDHHFTVTNMGSIVVQDYKDRYIYDNAAYAVISHGQNGYGAFPKIAVSNLSDSNLDSKLKSEVYNSYAKDRSNIASTGYGGSDYTDSAGYSPIIYIPTLDQESLTSGGVEYRFDDIVRYKTSQKIVAELGKIFADPNCLTAQDTLIGTNAEDICTETTDAPVDLFCAQYLRELAKAYFDRCLYD